MEKHLLDSIRFGLFRLAFFIDSIPFFDSAIRFLRLLKAALRLDGIKGNACFSPCRILQYRYSSPVSFPIILPSRNTAAPRKRLLFCISTLEEAALSGMIAAAAAAGSELFA